MPPVWKNRHDLGLNAAADEPLTTDAAAATGASASSSASALTAPAEPPTRSSTRKISSPAFRYASSSSRCSSTSVSNIVVTWKISGSGRNVIRVPLIAPVFPGGSGNSSPAAAGAPDTIGSVIFPHENPTRCRIPSPHTSAVSEVESALTTETPTPWSPPETLYPPCSAPNFPPAWSTVRTVSSALFCVLATFPTGIPRPLSTTAMRPSLRILISIAEQNPASASSTALSTTSHTRWCSPRGPVDPMYIPGRLRTGSSPSRTVMESAL
mmetsp:Transcript_21966/g.54303  ORF Transcript_21966/g.54303 Transcript_21966/m.54303 type:complete len:268 (-) Transcript_21966:13-816(-)